MADAGSFEDRGRAEPPGLSAPAAPHGLRLHRDHAFGGMEIIDSAPRAIVARCECGALLDVAEATLDTCPDCLGEPGDCLRCGGTGEVVDHAALEWRRPEQWRDQYGDIV